MEINATFDSWAELEKALNEFTDRTFQPFFRHTHVRTVDYANQRIKGEKKYKQELKYIYDVIECVHSGTYTSKARDVSLKFFVKCIFTEIYSSFFAKFSL